MANLHFEFVSPESVLFSGDVDQVDLPGAEGDMGILADHAPLVTTLRPGLVTVFRGGAREPIVITGGFAEVGPDRQVWDYAALVTSLDSEILTLGQLYRDRADCENTFDELKNQWGWGGFTTHDHRVKPGGRL